MVKCCCVVGCSNTHKNSKCSFYRFPAVGYKIEQRKKWIAAVRRKNPDGSEWVPKSYHLICSEHFVGGERSLEQSSPSYVPTIFPHTKINKRLANSALNRHKRFMEKWKKENMEKSITFSKQQSIFQQSMQKRKGSEIDSNLQVTLQIDQSCQAEIFFNSREIGKTFTCNRYITNNICDAEIQTDINIPNGIIRIPNKRQFKNKACGTR